MWVAFQVGGPILLVSLVVGVVVSIIQAATQVNEATLAYVPKIVAVFFAVLVLGPWMMETMLGFSAGLFANLDAYGH
jgi:flagellar biosynthetic protein FliQ